jgi:hypothetical protein
MKILIIIITDIERKVVLVRCLKVPALVSVSSLLLFGSEKHCLSCSFNFLSQSHFVENKLAHSICSCSEYFLIVSCLDRNIFSLG